MQRPLGRRTAPEPRAEEARTPGEESEPRQVPLEALLRAEAHGARRRRLWLVALGIAAGAALLVAYLVSGPSELPAGSRFQVEKAFRGPLVAQVTATGTLEPRNTVQVGAEISGQIDQVDVDYNDPVKKGQVLAVIDTQQLQADVVQARATLRSAQADAVKAQATARKTAADLARDEKLAKSGVVSEQALDAAREAATAAEAVLASSKAKVAAAEATLKIKATNLSKAVIHSPIDGVVLTRNVDPGQTVASSFQTPILFQIAEDLRKMELQVDVDEADVGRVHPGQKATFSVDAYPDHSFEGTITEVRYAPETVEGVVTYKAVLDVDNPDLLLRPGMTATAQIATQREADALQVPDAALRFTPPPPPRRSFFGRLFSHRRATPGSEETQPAGRRVYVLKDGRLAAVPVKTGISSGGHTQIVSGKIEVGTPVVVGLEHS